MGDRVIFLGTAAPLNRGIGLHP